MGLTLGNIEGGFDYMPCHIVVIARRAAGIGLQGNTVVTHFSVLYVVMMFSNVADIYSVALKVSVN